MYEVAAEMSSREQVAALSPTSPNSHLRITELTRVDSKCVCSCYLLYLLACSQVVAFLAANGIASSCSNGDISFYGSNDAVPCFSPGNSKCFISSANRPLSSMSCAALAKCVPTHGRGREGGIEEGGTVVL